METDPKTRPAGAVSDEAFEAAIWRSVFGAFTVLFNAVEADVKAAADLSLTDMAVLFMIVHRPEGVPMGRLAAELRVDPSVVTYRMKRLEGMGLARREPSPDDQRSILARETPATRPTMRSARAAMLDSAHRHLFGHLAGEQADALGSIARHLIRARSDAAQTKE